MLNNRRPTSYKIDIKVKGLQINWLKLQSPTIPYLQSGITFIGPVTQLYKTNLKSYNHGFGIPESKEMKYMNGKLGLKETLYRTVVSAIFCYEKAEY